MSKKQQKKSTSKTVRIRKKEDVEKLQEDRCEAEKKARVTDSTWVRHWEKKDTETEEKGVPQRKKTGGWKRPKPFNTDFEEEEQREVTEKKKKREGERENKVEDKKNEDEKTE